MIAKRVLATLIDIAALIGCFALAGWVGVAIGFVMPCLMALRSEALLK